MAIEDDIFGSSVLDSQRLEMPSINSPMDFAATPSLSGPGRVSVKAPSKLATGAASLQAGLAAGQTSGAQNSYDSTDAAISIGGATLAGAASGAMVGGAPGAAVGAVAGALTSSVNAWMSVRAQRRRRRALEALRKEAQEREDMEKMEQRSKDKAAMELQAKQGAAAAYDKNAKELQRMLANNVSLRKLYVKDGYV